MSLSPTPNITHEPSSYFQWWDRRQGHSDSDSSNVSPGTRAGPGHLLAAASDLERPRPVSRSSPDCDSLLSAARSTRGRFPTTTELPSPIVELPSPPPTRQRPSGQSVDSSSSSHQPVPASAFHSARSSLASAAHKVRTRLQSTVSNYRHQRNSSSRSSVKHKIKQLLDRPTSLPAPEPKPLRPPITSSVSAPISHHTVKLETSFTKPRADPVITESSSQAGSTLRPRDLISAPIAAIRSLSVRPLHVTFSLRQPQKDKIPHLSSTAFAKQNRTKDRLEQVASLLHLVAGSENAAKFPSKRASIRALSGRTLSDKSERSGGKSHQPQSNPASSPVSVVTKMVSRQPTHDSYASSLLEYRMGLGPTVTPDPKETYRIKRSPSAESEEFLKIDISIRGETSYLPSEARRIHTPPLPRETPGGTKRGFFFDYTPVHGQDVTGGESATKESEAKEMVPLGLEYKGGEEHMTRGMIGSQAPQNQALDLADRSAASMLRRRWTAKRAAPDWYEAELAKVDDLDSSGHDELAAAAQKLHLQQGERCTGAATDPEGHHHRRHCSDDKVDHTIPEHLPSSPLCPRHPRYWRIAKGAGTKEMCWMHGRNE